MLHAETEMVKRVESIFQRGKGSKTWNLEDWFASLKLKSQIITAQQPINFITCFHLCHSIYRCYYVFVYEYLIRFFFFFFNPQVIFFSIKRAFEKGEEIFKKPPHKLVVWSFFFQLKIICMVRIIYPIFSSTVSPLITHSLYAHSLYARGNQSHSSSLGLEVFPSTHGVSGGVQPGHTFTPTGNLESPFQQSCSSLVTQVDCRRRRNMQTNLLTATSQKITFAIALQIWHDYLDVTAL